MLDLTLKSSETINDRVRLLTFCASDGGALPDYQAGAHIDFDLDETGVRSYSLIDFEPKGALVEKYVIGVQVEPDGQGGSQKMHALSIGDTVSASRPKNDFQLVDDDRPVVLIAGGIGITPLISFSSALTTDARSFQFHYAARTRGAAAFADRIGLSFGSALTMWPDDENPINLGSIVGNADPGTHFYCCGPKGMMDAVRATCIDHGVASDHIHFELFTTPESEEGDKPFEIEIADSGQVFEVPVGKTIIEVLEEAGIDVMYDCQRGDCGICQTDVVSGIPDHRDVVLSQEERDSGNVMQICVSRAKSDRIVLDI